MAELISNNAVLAAHALFNQNGVRNFGNDCRPQTSSRLQNCLGYDTMKKCIFRTRSVRALCQRSYGVLGIVKPEPMARKMPSVEPD